MKENSSPSNPNLEENELMRKIKEGNTLAFTTLYNTYYDVLHQIIYNVVKNKDVADDLISIVFTKAHSKIETYVNYISPFMWLKTIAVNTSIDYLRKSKKELYNQYIDDEANYLQLNARDHNDPQSNLEYNETINILNEGISKLKKKHRQAIEMKLSGMSYKEIASELETTEAVIKSSLNKARNKLKKYLLTNQ